MRKLSKKTGQWENFCNVCHKDDSQEDYRGGYYHLSEINELYLCRKHHGVFSEYVDFVTNRSIKSFLNKSKKEKENILKQQILDIEPTQF